MQKQDSINKVELIALETQAGCNACFFNGLNCDSEAMQPFACNAEERSDGRDIIWVHKEHKQ